MLLSNLNAYATLPVLYFSIFAKNQQLCQLMLCLEQTMSKQQTDKINDPKNSHSHSNSKRTSNDSQTWKLQIGNFMTEEDSTR